MFEFLPRHADLTVFTAFHSVVRAHTLRARSWVLKPPAGVLLVLNSSQCWASSDSQTLHRELEGVLLILTCAGGVVE